MILRGCAEAWADKCDVTLGKWCGAEESNSHVLQDSWGNLIPKKWAVSPGDVVLDLCMGVCLGRSLTENMGPVSCFPSRGDAGFG